MVSGLQIGAFGVCCSGQEEMCGNSRIDGKIGDSRSGSQESDNDQLVSIKSTTNPKHTE